MSCVARMRHAMGVRSARSMLVLLALAVFVCLLFVWAFVDVPLAAPTSSQRAAAAAAAAVDPVQCGSRSSEVIHRFDAAAVRPNRTVYVITPTYPRAVQIAELTRLAQTLMLTPHVFWVVSEDAAVRTPAVSALLLASGVTHVHILGVKPERYRNQKRSFVPRGVSNRVAALDWVRQHTNSGVVYFADDDNTYDYRLFFQMAETRRVSVFPVGLVTDYGVSTPVVQLNADSGRPAVIGFYDGWVAGRQYPMDMAGFAVSVELLHQRPQAIMPFKPGYEEDGFLKSLAVPKEEFELLADNCTQILVWHTQTKQRGPFTRIDMSKYAGTNVELLSSQILQK